MIRTDVSRQKLLEEAVSSIFGVLPKEMSSPFTVSASPAWRGVEGDLWLAEDDGQTVIIKHYNEDTHFYVDKSAAILAASEASKLGITPSVVKSWPDEGIIAFEALRKPWVAGGLHHAINQEIRQNVIQQKRLFQSKAKLEKKISIFDEINNFYNIVKKENIVTHNDIVAFMEFSLEAEKKIRSCDWDTVPCHRDGNTSNLMVNEDKSVMLIDFDLSANCDPFEDIGAHLIEYFENEVDARGGFEEWNGSFDEGLFQRAMIYGFADDLRWGLIGAIMGALSTRKSLEFSKYAAWRFIRLQAHVKCSSANDRIRSAA